MGREDIGFWLAVMLVAVAGVALFKILGARVGDQFPALRDLAAAI
jgi:hypothetical protein